MSNSPSTTTMHTHSSLLSSVSLYYAYTLIFAILGKSVQSDIEVIPYSPSCQPWNAVQKSELACLHANGQGWVGGRGRELIHM